MSTPLLPRIALTPGEPAGIGPDITLQLAQCPLAVQLIVFADPDLLAQRAALLGIPVSLQLLSWPISREEIIPYQSGQLNIVPISLLQPVTAGQLQSANARYVLETLKQAGQACLEKHTDALVTAPVHKGIINDAGFHFTGHTEFFAELTGVKQVVMMLATKTLRVALVTTHLPLSQVSATITVDRLETVIKILHTDLQKKFHIRNPHILVCGLNPHAGEGGHLGMEEILTIIPVLHKLRQEGMQLMGPVPADTAFTSTSLTGVDAVLTMYHDQGLPVLKQQGFGEAVNITLGLPIIRTSVDHGTALDLAGTGRARSDSLYKAVQMAIEMAEPVKF